MATEKKKKDEKENLIAFQKSFTEAIHRENKIRVKWHLEHGAGFRRGVDSCAWDDEPDDDDEDFIPEKAQFKAEPKTPQAVDVGKKRGIEERAQLLLAEEAEESKVHPLAVMKPVPAQTKRLLYKGLSDYGEGRSQYLKTRYKQSPEGKFYFPVCSSWEYGWTYGQEQEFKCPDYGRRQIIKTSFYRPNDPQLKPREGDNLFIK